ncbi:MAG: hypothetical protein HMLIMOIP_002676 [Candidatus Nitrosomirales archaeon]|jgi:hypothetical protein
MSIFGKIDAQTISSNPYYVEKGDYTAEITDAKYKKDQEGKRQFVIDFTIDNEDSEFFDQRVSKYFDLVDEDMDDEAFALLPPEEKKTVRRNMAALKNTLCGSGRNKGLGVDPDDLNDESWDPSVLKGTKVDLSISNYGPTGDGVNVRWANIRE